LSRIVHTLRHNAAGATEGNMFVQQPVPRLFCERTAVGHCHWANHNYRPEQIRIVNMSALFLAMPIYGALRGRGQHFRCRLASVVLGRHSAPGAVCIRQASSFTQSEVDSLQNAIAALRRDPSLLQSKELEFVRQWMHEEKERADRARIRAGFPALPPPVPPPPPPQQQAPPQLPQPAAQSSMPRNVPWKTATPDPPSVPIFYPPEMRDLPTGKQLPDGLKVFIATPAYGGNVTVDYMTSVVHIVTQLKEVAWQLRLTAGESIITVGRNNAVMEFLASGCTHLLFLDADVAVGVETIKNLLAEDVDVALAPYPAKNLNEEKMQEAVLRRGGLPRLRDGLHYVLHAQPKTVGKAFDEGRSFVEVDAGPTGCMLIKRGVFDKLREAYPNMHCRINGTNQGRSMQYDVWWRFFDTMVDEGGEFLGEDIAFCRRWRDIGGTIWADLGATLCHVGRHAYTGSMMDDAPIPQR